MTDSFRDDYREAVVFAFYQDGKLLIEKRPVEKGTDIFIPNGGIEEKDKNQKENYKVVSLKREVGEEMGIELIFFEYLMDCKVEEIKILFYVYLVTKWQGEIPLYTVEPPNSNQKFADLEWINILDYKNVFIYPAAKLISEKIIQKFGLR